MAEGENKIIRRRLAGAWLSTVISISLVLLLVGIASLLLVNAKNVSEYFKENMQVSVMMKQEVDEEEAGKFQQQLDSMPFVRETRFVSKAQGSKEMADMLGEDFLNVFHRRFPKSRLRFSRQPEAGGEKDHGVSDGGRGSVPAISGGETEH